MLAVSVTSSDVDALARSRSAPARHATSDASLHERLAVLHRYDSLVDACGLGACSKHTHAPTSPNGRLWKLDRKSPQRGTRWLVPNRCGHRSRPTRPGGGTSRRRIDGAGRGGPAPNVRSSRRQPSRRFPPRRVHRPQVPTHRPDQSDAATALFNRISSVMERGEAHGTVDSQLYVRWWDLFDRAALHGLATVVRARSTAPTAPTSLAARVRGPLGDVRGRDAPHRTVRDDVTCGWIRSTRDASDELLCVVRGLVVPRTGDRRSPWTR